MQPSSCSRDSTVIICHGSQYRVGAPIFKGVFKYLDIGFDYPDKEETAISGIDFYFFMLSLSKNPATAISWAAFSELSLHTSGKGERGNRKLLSADSDVSCA